MTEEPNVGTGTPEPPQPMAANLPLDPAQLSGAAQDVPAQAPPAGGTGFLPDFNAPPPQLPQRPIGTSVASQPVDRKTQFRQMLGDFLFSVGKGLASRGSGPDADARGAGAAITAIPERNIMQQQLAIEQQKAQAEADFRKAQAGAVTAGAEPIPVNINGQTIMLPATAAKQILAAQAAGLSRENVQGKKNEGALDVQESKNTGAKDVAGIRADSAEAIAGQKIEANKQLSADKLNMMRQVLQNTKDNQAARLVLARQGFGIRQQEFAQKQDALTPQAQKTLMETTPVHDQIKDLLQQFEPMKDDNTPAKFLAERAKYAVGIQSPIGTASDTIAQLELNKIVGAARVLKGGSRAIQALQMAMTHLPNVWVDSPKLIHSKLENLDGALQQVEDASYTYGKKTGQVPPSGTGSSTGKSLAQAKSGAGKYSPDNPFK